MKIESKINLNEKIENTVRKTNNEVTYFYPVFLIKEDNFKSSTKVALFTEHEINKATTRGDKNVEDIQELILNETVLEYEIAKLKKDIEKLEREKKGLTFKLEDAEIILNEGFFKKLFRLFGLR